MATSYLVIRLLFSNLSVFSFCSSRIEFCFVVSTKPRDQFLLKYFKLNRKPLWNIVESGLFASEILLVKQVASFWLMFTLQSLIKLSNKIDLYFKARKNWSLNYKWTNLFCIKLHLGQRRSGEVSSYFEFRVAWNSNGLAFLFGRVESQSLFYVIFNQFFLN